MSKQRYVNTKIWEDAWFNDLDPVEKLFFVYLLTNPMTNIVGIYELSKGTIGRATGLESRVVEEILRRFEESEKVFYRNGWVILKNFVKHQNYKSPKIIAGIKAELKNVPKNIVELAVFPEDIYGIDTVSHLNTNSNTNSNTNINDEEKSSSNKISYEPVDLELADLLLAKIKANTPTFKQPNIEKWAEQIRLMRERDSRTYSQIEYVINWCQQDNFWGANILSTKKLREKFDTLVAQIKRGADKNKINKNNVIL